ncbi:MAG TPA: Ig-like domain repeat protein [Actinomycetota bacterium]|nr:Ig-like domain repeat protein [Actinomycetota bacterium]
MKVISTKRVLSVLLLDAPTRKRLTRFAHSLRRPLRTLPTLRRTSISFPTSLRRPLAALLATLLPIIGTVTFLAPTAHAALGSIVFSSDRSGPYRIWTMNNDGTAQTRITNSLPKYQDYEPAWSPDGSKIVFVRVDAEGDIYVMNSDGSGLVQLTATAADDRSPDWSPDGSEIVFQRNSSIWKMNANGTGAVALTTAGEEPAAWPTWSADGNKIVFADHHGTSTWGITTIDPDGSNHTHLSAGGSNDTHPVYSGNGSKIAFTSDLDGNEEIYTMNSDGSGLSRLTNNAASDDFPAWTPDPQIAFSSTRTGNHDIFKMNSDGTGVTQLTTNSGEDKDPDWAVGDIVPPLAPTINSIPADPSGDPNPSWSFTGEAGGSYQCELRRGATIVAALASCTSAKSYSISPIVEGTYTFAVKQTDDAGNEGPEGTDDFTLDMIEPGTTIDSGPTGTITTKNASFTFSSDVSGAGFQCSIDGSSFLLGACNSPAAYTALAEGDHTFEVRAVDSYGIVDPTPASRTFTVDTVGPAAPSIDSGPAGTVAIDDVTFTFSGPGSSYECAIDGGAFSSCTSPRAYNNLTDATHTFDVRSFDNFGNPSTTTSRTFTVDTTAPQTTINSGPTGTIATNQATFGFSTNDPAAIFECKLDSGSFQSCTSTTNYTGLSQGSHTFEVRASDAVGNTDQTPASRTFTVDTQGPIVTIDSGPSGPTNNDSPTFVFSSNDGTGTYSCSLDGAAFTDCTSPISYSGLSETAHTFEVKGTDEHSNTGASASSNFTVDLTGPEIPTVTSAPAEVTPNDFGTFEFESNDSTDTFRCSIDSDPYAICSSGITYPNLSEGLHTFAVVAVDLAGNESEPTYILFTVDTNAPETTIDSGPNGLIGFGDASWEFSADEMSTFECSFDGGAFNTCFSPQSYVGLSDGIHDFEVRAIDQVGHIDPSPATASIVVDTSAPALVTITSGPSGDVNTEDVTFEFTSDDPTNDFECSLDAGSFVSCTSPTDFNDLSDGNHIFAVRAVDDAGNTGPSTLRTFKVDTVAPGDPTISGASGSVPTDDVNFSVSTNDSGATFECSMDGAAFAPCSSNPSYSDLGEGGHTFSVVAIDLAGNSSGTSTANFTVDTLVPGGATITSGPSGNINFDDVSFGFTSEDATDHFECSFDSGTFTVCGSPSDYFDLTNGDHTFDVRAVDDAGNAGPAATRSFTVDTVAPDAPTIDSGPSGDVATASVTFELSSNDSTATFECSMDGGAFAPCSSSTDYDLGEGGHTFDVRAVDPAGNTGATTTQNFTVDTIAPDSVTITDGPSGSTSNDDVSFEFNSDDPADHFECSLDGAAFTTCTSPANYTNVDEGDHTFEVRAVDDAGNVGPGTIVTFEVEEPSSGSNPEPVPSPSGSGEPAIDPTPSPTPSSEPTSNPAPGGSQGGKGGGRGNNGSDDSPSDSGASGSEGSTPEAPGWSSPTSGTDISPVADLFAGDTKALRLNERSKGRSKRHNARPGKTSGAEESDAAKVADERGRLGFAGKSKAEEEKALPLWIGRAAQTVKTFSFPFVLVLLVLLYLVSQHWIDRKTPKLAIAPINARFDIVRFR